MQDDPRFVENNQADVGVVVFGKDKKLAAAVADLITVQLATENISAARHTFVSPNISVLDQVKQPRLALETNADSDSVLDAIWHACPKLSRAHVVVAHDNIGLRVAAMGEQPTPSKNDGAMHDLRSHPAYREPVPVYDSRENTIFLARSGADIGTNVPESQRFKTISAYDPKREHSVQMLRNLVMDTENKLSNVIRGTITKAIESVGTFAAEDQKIATEILLAELANSDAILHAFAGSTIYAQGLCNLDPENVGKIISTFGNKFKEEMRGIPQPYGGTDHPDVIEQELREVMPGLPQGAIDAFMGRKTKFDVPQPIKVMVGNKEVTVKPVGEKMDQLLRFKVLEAKARELAAAAEAEMEQTLEEIEEQLSELEVEPDPPVQPSRFLTPEVIARNRGKELPYMSEEKLDKVLTAIGEPENTNSAFQQEMAGIIKDLSTGREVSVEQFNGKTDEHLIITNDVEEKSELDRLTEVSHKAKPYVTLQKKLADGSLTLGDIDTHLKKGEKATFGEVVMSRF